MGKEQGSSLKQKKIPEYPVMPLVLCIGGKSKYGTKRSG